MRSFFDRTKAAESRIKHTQ